MDWVYQYRDPDVLYLNVTNRCTNRCTFCVRSTTSRLGDGHLLGGREPTFDELIDAVEARGGPESFREIVWCGYGEPTFRLDLIRLCGPIFHSAGAEIRLNTNGHGCLIHERDIIPELAPVIDRVSVSLNAPTADRYVELCRPAPETVPGSPPPRAFWDAMLDFLKRSPSAFSGVCASVVGHALTAREIDEALAVVSGIGNISFRVR